MKKKNSTPVRQPIAPIVPRIINSKLVAAYVGGKAMLQKLHAIGLRPISEGHKAVRYDLQDVDRYIDAMKGGMRA